MHISGSDSKTLGSTERPDWSHLELQILVGGPVAVAVPEPAHLGADALEVQPAGSLGHLFEARQEVFLDAAPEQGAGVLLEESLVEEPAAQRGHLGQGEGLVVELLLHLRQGEAFLAGHVAHGVLVELQLFR